MVCGDNSKSRVYPNYPGDRQQQFVRLHGLTRPLHKLQVAAWIVIFVYGLIFFGIVAPSVVDTWKPAAFVCIGLLYVVHIVTYIVATVVNPADDNAKVQMKKRHEVPKFDRSKHRHVIENEYCNLCETYVEKTSKHCRACNKCVSNFDHHCLWLNNCVGGVNYRYFLVTISSAFLGTLTITTVTLFVFINSFLEFNMLDEDVWWKKTVPEVFQGLMGVLIVLCLVCAILLGQLVFFHLYLLRKGLTTYQHIQNTRAKESTNSNSEHSVPAEVDTTPCAAPSTVIGAEAVYEKKFGNIKESNGIDSQQGINNESDITSQFTNAAFSSDEIKSTNEHSNDMQTGAETG